MLNSEVIESAEYGMLASLVFKNGPTKLISYKRTNYVMTNRQIYNKDSDFGQFKGDAIYSKKIGNIMTPGDLIYVISGDAAREKRYFFNGIYRYTEEVQTDRDLWRKYLIEPVSPLDPPVEITKSMLPVGHRVTKIITNPAMALGNVPAEYKRLYDELIVANGPSISSLETDVTELIDNRKTDVVRDVMCRLGQGEFKRNVIKVWGSNTCALTGIDVPELLIASHIKPWRNCESGEHRNGCNGILLASHIDKLFDSHLITFREVNGSFFLEVNPKYEPLVEQHFKIKNRRLNLGKMSLSDSRIFEAFLRIHNQAFDLKRGI